MTRDLRTTSNAAGPTVHGRPALSMARSIALGLALGLALAGCGASSSGSSSGAGTAADVAAAESTAASAAADAPDDSNGSGDKALFTDAEACAWLKSNMKKIRAAPGDVDAQLVLTFGASAFFEKHGGLENADGFALDDATARGCQAEHDEAIKKANIKSFGNL